MFKRFSIFILLFTIIFCSCKKALAGDDSDLVISNNYFSFTMPIETRGTYKVAKENNGIYILEKVSEKLGLGGFAFGLKIYKNPSDYADTPGNKKLGELTDKKGVLYDMVLIRPTEIEYGDTTKVQEDYNRLYEAGNSIQIKGVNGSKYVQGQGTKGEFLYGDILKKYKEENKDLLKTKTGYAFYDINSDGIDELFIGKKDIIYDVYTMVNRHPEYVVSKGDADKLYVCNDYFLCSEYSFDKNERTYTTYILNGNSPEVYPQISYIYNANKNKKQPWFMTFGNSDEWENIPKKLFKERIKAIKEYKKFNFIPLNSIE